jgi:hypothetical protein
MIKQINDKILFIFHFIRFVFLVVKEETSDKTIYTLWN